MSREFSARMTEKFNVGGIPCHTVHDTVRLRLLRKALSCVSGPLSRARAYKLLIYTTVNVCTMLWDLHQNMPVRLRPTGIALQAAPSISRQAGRMPGTSMPSWVIFAASIGPNWQWLPSHL